MNRTGTPRKPRQNWLGQTNPEDVILVNALRNLILPESSTPQFVRVAAFSQKNVALFEPTGLNFILGRFGFFHVSQIQPAVFNIGNANVRNGASRISTEVTPQGDARRNFGHIAKTGHFPFDTL